MEDDPTVFSCRSLPEDPRLLAPVTSACVGTQVYRDALHVSGVYNGAGPDTHRAHLPSPLNVRLLAPAARETFALDTKTGTFVHSLQGADFWARQRVYAHRALPRLLVLSVDLGRCGPSTGRPITVCLQADFSPHSPDVALQAGPDFRGARYLHGRTLVPEQPGCALAEVHLLWMPVPLTLSLATDEQERTWDFLTLVAGSRAQAEAQFLEALSMRAAGTLFPRHSAAWAELWEAWAADLEGPLALRQALRGCLYYTLSALPPPGCPEPFHGLSPGGLSNGGFGQCYWGHVFWDQDVWMFPSILLLEPTAARSILEYRIRTLAGALANAELLGFQGAKFAWESAISGREVCPEEIYGTQEIHVNGAVLLAFQLYYQATQDMQLFREAGGWDVVRAVADFWCSRVTWCPEEQNYHLRGVMPPDEYHPGVNNSVYTNVLAQTGLRFAAELARDLGRPVPDLWVTVAEKMKVPFDAERNYHPEFDGYEPGQTVKQADVVLLGYPVPYGLSPEVRRANLEAYEAATSCRGPAMSWVRGRGRAWGRGGAGGASGPAEGRPGAPPPEHVCCGLAGAEGAPEGPGTAPEVLLQHLGALQGVDGERGRLGRCELPDRDGGLPAGGAVRLHRPQDHQGRPALRPRVLGPGSLRAAPGGLLSGPQAPPALLRGGGDHRSDGLGGPRGPAPGGGAAAFWAAAPPARGTRDLLPRRCREDPEGAGVEPGGPHRLRERRLQS